MGALFIAQRVGSAGIFGLLFGGGTADTSGNATGGDGSASGGMGGGATADTSGGATGGDGAASGGMSGGSVSNTSGNATGSDGAAGGGMEGLVVVPANTPTFIAREGRRPFGYTGYAGMPNTPLGPKDPAEVVLIAFPFARRLNGATMASAATEVSLYKGTDASPTNVKSGSPAVVGTSVLQRMQGGVDGAAYKWRVTVLDSNGQTHVMTDWVQVRTL